MEAKYKVVLIKANYPHEPAAHVLRDFILGAPQFAFGTEHLCLKTLPDASIALMKLQKYFDNRIEVNQYTLMIIEETKI